MEEGSSKGVQDRVARSGGEEKGTSAVVVRKTVTMSDTRDFIPCADYGDSRSSGSAAPSVALLDVASCTGSSEALSRDEGMQQDTPNYIRQGAAARTRIAPLELFSAAPSPAKAAALESSQPEAGAGGAQEEATDCKSLQGTQPTEQGGDRDCCGQLRQEYHALLREKGECRRLLEDLMRENELKSKECHEAQTSLHELQVELMRKSMHVGSLAFAVEGQVKEKSRWCQLLKNSSEKFKALKTEHQILVKESEEYKRCLSDATQMTTTIHHEEGSSASSGEPCIRQCQTIPWDQAFKGVQFCG